MQVTAASCSCFLYGTSPVSCQTIQNGLFPPRIVLYLIFSVFSLYSITNNTENNTEKKRCLRYTLNGFSGGDCYQKTEICADNSHVLMRRVNSACTGGRYRRVSSNAKK